MKRSSTEWENTLSHWSQPLGKVEDEKAQRAVDAVERAVRASVALNYRSVTTFVQGSYRNKTGVRQESDVDVCVFSTASFFHNDIPWPHTDVSLGLSPATYHFATFRDDVENALVAHFGRAVVKPGNKAFNVRENTYRVEADVVPCFEYRHYMHAFGTLRTEYGTCLFSRDGQRIINFPEQQFRNGLQKDVDTQFRFKPLVRMIKKLSCEMEDAGIAAATPMKSFLLESLVWNMPNELFVVGGLWQRLGETLSLISILAEQGGGSLKEENGIKALFGATATWTAAEVRAFAVAARLYLGF